MKLGYGVFVLAAIGLLTGGLLTGCSGYSPQDMLNRAQPVGSPFSKYLAIEYKTLANRFHGSDSSYFAKKGLAAIDGVIVQPETLEGKALDGPAAAEMAEARGELISMLNEGGRDRAPDIAAVAQTRFDCWLTLRGGTFLNRRPVRFPDENISCKQKFQTAMELLHQALQIAPPPAMPPPPLVTAPINEFPAPIEAGSGGVETPADEMSSLVFFDWNKYEITPGAYDVLLAALQTIKTRTDINQIMIDGYTDTSGGEKYNMKLSMKRANVVRAFLVKHGIPAKKIHVTGHGEHDLLVQTPQGVREPQNRRAQITFE